MFGLNDLALKILGAILAVLAIFGFGYYKGSNNVQVVFDQYKADVVAAAKAQAAEAAKKDAKNAKLITETKSAYNSQLTNLRNYYGLRLNKSSGSLSAVPPAATGAYGYSPDNLPPTPILAAQCAEETLKLVKLQEFNAKVAENME